MDALESAGKTDAQKMMFSIIQRIATGPDLSKDISEEEARVGMLGVLSGEIDPVRAGIFLIALRMKRETAEENRGVLQAILDSREPVIAEVDDLVDIGRDDLARIEDGLQYAAVLLRGLALHAQRDKKDPGAHRVDLAAEHTAHAQPGLVLADILGQIRPGGDALDDGKHHPLQLGFPGGFGGIH